MVYQIHYVGGPKDGEMDLAVRPYHRLDFGDDVYLADPDDPDFELWIDDDTRSITLTHETHSVV